MQMCPGFNLYTKVKVIKSLLVIRVTNVSWQALMLTHGPHLVPERVDREQGDCLRGQITSSGAYLRNTSPSPVG